MSTSIRCLVVATVAFSIGCGGGTFKPIVGDDPAPAPSSSPPSQSSPLAWAPPPVAGALLVLRDGRTAIVSDADRDVVWIVDLDRQTAPVPVRLTPGDEPGRAIEDSSGAVHVVLRRAGAVVTLDPHGATVGSRRSVCAAPRGIAWDAAAGMVHVACESGELVSFSPGASSVRRTFIAPDLRDVVVFDGALYATTFRRPAVYAVDVDGRVARRIELPNAQSNQRDLTLAYRTIATPIGLVMLHQGVSTAPLGSRPSPSGGSYGSSEVTSGLPPVEVMLTDFNRPAGSSSVATYPAFPGLASDVALSSRDASANYVVLGEMPDGPVLWNPRCSVPATLLRERGLAVAWSSPDQLVVLTRSTSALPSKLLLTDRCWVHQYEEIVLAHPSIAQPAPDAFYGRDLFYHVTSSGFACASCHPEGGDDGRVWAFVAEGQRRTPSLRGGITRSAPFHWDGTLHDFNELAFVVFARMGDVWPAPTDLAALGAWLDTVPAVATEAPVDAGAVARGESLFHSPELGCVACHAGTLYTNNQTVDVGTGGAFQVPRLVGLAHRAPYMHAGCAATLRDRFTDIACGGGDRHGHTSQLSPAQIDDLVAWLSTL